MQKILIFSSLFAILLFFNATFSKSQTTAQNIVNPFQLSEEIELDGNFSEKCWENASKVTNFLQREPDNGKPSTELTEVAICYNSNTLYIGVWCYDKNAESIVKKGMKRDFEYWRDDIFQIVLDPYNQQTSGYLFIVNANGARGDALISRLQDGNFSWNGIWDVETKITDEGWFAEIEIPFSTLKFPDTEIQTWGANFERNIRHKVEQVRWQGWALDNDFTNLMVAGKIEDFKNITGQENLIFKPYALGGLSFISGEERKDITKIGGEIIYPITNSLNLSTTFNTDFAQIESDQLQVNITRFSKYYPEKRDFFLENSSIFNFLLNGSDNLFYSRNIGIDNGNLVPIIVGTKLTGSVNSTNIGLLSIQTDKQNDLMSTNYSVGRVEHNLNTNYTIGGIFTSKYNENQRNFAYGIDGNYSTSEFLGKYNLNVAGAFAQTNTQNGKNTDNNSITLYLNYPNSFLESEFLYNQIQKNFNPELGYVRRRNIKHISNRIEIKPRVNGWNGIRNFYFVPIDFNTYLTDETNKVESMRYELTPIGLSFISGDFVKFQIEYNYDRLDEAFSISDNFEFAAGKYDYNIYTLQVDTYGGRRLTSWFWFGVGDYYDADYLALEAYMQYSLTSKLSMSGSYSLNDIERDALKFISNQISGRIEYSFNPKLYSTLFAQWNDEIEDILLNFRINWIPVVGSDVYFVVNQRIATEGKVFDLKDMSVLLKVIWRFSV